MKKQEYHFDRPYFNELKSSHEYMAGSLSSLVSYMQTLGLKKRFDGEELQKLLANTEEYRSDLGSELRKAIELMKAPNVFVTRFEEEITDTLNIILEKVEAVQRSENQNREYASYSVTINYSLFEIGDNGKVTLPDRSIEKLKEEATTFIQTEKQQKVLSLIDEVNCKLNEIKEQLSESELGTSIVTPVNVINDGCEVSEGRYRLKPGFLSVLR